MAAAGTSYQCCDAFFGICGPELILLAWWNVVTWAHETYLKHWRNSIKQYQRMCHLTCSGPWCQPWLSSWCLPRLLPPWHVVLLSSGFVAVSDRWCHVMCFWASYGFLMFLMSGWAAWYFSANLLLAVMMFSANISCSKPKAAATRRVSEPVMTKSHWIHPEICDVHPQPILSKSRIIKNQILHVLHII